MSTCNAYTCNNNLCNKRFIRDTRVFSSNDRREGIKTEAAKNDRGAFAKYA